MDSIGNIFHDLMTASDLIADAIIKRTRPLEDELSTSEAYALYGRRWVEERLRQGFLHRSRISNRLVFSRHELKCLRVSERIERDRILYNGTCHELKKNSEAR